MFAARIRQAYVACAPGIEPSTRRSESIRHHADFQIEPGHAADQIVVAVRHSGSKSQIDVASVSLEFKSALRDGNAASQAKGSPPSTPSVLTRALSFRRAAASFSRLSGRVSGQMYVSPVRRVDARRGTPLEGSLGKDLLEKPKAIVVGRFGPPHDASGGDEPFGTANAAVGP